jgi:pantoate--beta-alanine ligase
MKLIESVAELQAQSRAWRDRGEPVGFVATMGALHDGHLSLVRAAQLRDRRVIVSVFVNPTQFNDPGDLAAYPRSLDTDSELLRDAGVDALFVPRVEEMYPDGLSATRVEPGSLGELLEGQSRPGHFSGVATVVARLLNAALPDRAYFGQKDAQQVAVVRAMVSDLAFPVEIVACPTVREADGLAMSSRNQRLGAADRVAALGLVRALDKAQSMYQAGERDGVAVGETMERLLQQSPTLSAQYAVVVDPGTFLPKTSVSAGDLAVIAASVGGVRLIDNAMVGAGDLLRFRARELQEA